MAEIFGPRGLRPGTEIASTAFNRVTRPAPTQACLCSIQREIKEEQ